MNRDNWLQCPDCKGAMAVEIATISRKRYIIKDMIHPKDLIENPEVPTFNICAPHDLPYKTITLLKCAECGKLFPETAKNIALDTIWQTVALENFQAELFGYVSPQVVFKLTRRPKESV